MKPAGFAAKTAALTRKDLRLELRARDTLPPMVVFGAAVGLLLAFTLPGSSALSEPARTPFGTVALADVVAGMLWVTVLFSGLIGFSRTFELERREGALDSLLLAPVDRSSLFVSKGVTNLLYLVAVEAVLLPAFALLFGIDLGRSWAGLIAVAILVDVAFAAAGTTFAALSSQTTSRELMLPILALPALVPVFIGATELTSALFVGAGVATIASAGWFGILVAFDLVFCAAGLIAFDYVLE